MATRPTNIGKKHVQKFKVLRNYTLEQICLKKAFY